MRARSPRVPDENGPGAECARPMRSGPEGGCFAATRELHSFVATKEYNSLVEMQGYSCSFALTEEHCSLALTE